MYRNVLLATLLLAGLPTEALADGITGTIRNATTGNVVSGVTVVVFSSASAFVTNATTDGAGVYATGNLPTGSYFVRTANSQGLIDQLHNGITCLSCDVTTGTPISVSVGLTTTIDFTLTPGGRISGTVTNSTTSAPVDGGTVQVYTSGGTFVASAITNSAGSYTIPTGLPTGSYLARTSNSQGLLDELHEDIPCLNCNVTTGNAIMVTVPQTTTVNFALAPGGRISGTVTNATTGDPANDVTVQVYTTAGAFVSSASTNASGFYIVPTGLPTGSYVARTSNSQGLLDELHSDIPCLNCDVTTGNPIAVTVPATTTTNFALTPGGRISGTVTNATTGLVVGDVTVQVYTTAGTFVSSAITNSSGVYTTPAGLPTGSYVARTSNSQGLINQLHSGIVCLDCDVTTGTPIAVTVPATTTINFALAPGGRLSGTVQNASTGSAVGDVTVQVYTSTGTLVLSARTNAAGTYTTSAGLPAGSYVARTVNSQGLIDQLYSGMTCLGCNVTAGTPIPVTAGATATVNFALAQGGRISGTVTNATTGAALSGITVDVYTSAGTFVTSGITNAAGSYTSSSGLPTGSYFARTVNSQGYVNQLHNGMPCLNCSVTTGTPIGVTAGAPTAINFALAPGGRISGTVTNVTTGAALSGVTVDVYNSSGTFVTSGITNTAGSYTTTSGLPAGSYFARTVNSQGFIDQLHSGMTCLSCNVTTGTPISVTTTTTTINFALARSGLISGTVTNAATGAVLSGVTVQVYTTAGTFVTSAVTSAGGVYTTAGLPPASYVARTVNSQGFIDQLHSGMPCTGCNVTTGTPITVTAAATTTINFALTLGDRIIGTVTSAATGAPLSGVTVDVYNGAGAFVTLGTTNGAGVYTTSSGLPAGSYFARTVNSQGYIDQLHSGMPCVSCDVTTGTPIAVTAGANTTVDFALAQGGRISGTVTSAATGAGLSGVTVTIYTSAGTFATSTSTDAQGVYMISASLPGGTYYARTFVPSGLSSYQDELYNSMPCTSCVVTTGTPISVTTGATRSGVNFALLQPAPVVTRADFNGDGRADILWRHTSGTVTIWLMNGARMIGGDAVAVIDPSWQIFGTGDYNGDGRSDILWRHTSGTVTVWLMNGTQIIGGDAVAAAIDPSWQIFGSGDYNGDGRSDILWRHTSGTVTVWLMDGSRIIGGDAVAVIDPSWQIVGSGDYNGDDHADILWRHTSGGVTVWLMNGTRIIGGEGVATIGRVWQIVGSGDYNGDGFDDILWRHGAGAVTIWFMNGARMIGGDAVAAIDPAWQIVGAGDHNGDVHADLLWRNTSGAATIWLMNGAAINGGDGISTADPAWRIVYTR